MKDKDTQSEEFEAHVERLLLGKHPEGSPEMAHRPEQTGVLPPGKYNVTFDANGTAQWNPLPPNFYVGDGPNQYVPPPAPYYQPPSVINTVSALTEERVREIFREELAKWEQDLAKRMRGQSQHDWAMASQKGSTKAEGVE